MRERLSLCSGLVVSPSGDSNFQHDVSVHIHMPHTGSQERISTGGGESIESPLLMPARLVTTSSGSLGARGSHCVASTGTHTNATTLESCVCRGTGRTHQASNGHAQVTEPRESCLCPEKPIQAGGQIHSPKTRKSLCSQLGLVLEVSSVGLDISDLDSKLTSSSPL